MTISCVQYIINNITVRFGFCDIQNNQGLGKGYNPQPSALADRVISPTLIILDITITSFKMTMTVATKLFLEK